MGGTGVAVGLRAVVGLVMAVAVALPAAAAPVCSDQLVGVNERCPQWSAGYNHTGGRGGDGEDIGRAVAVTPDGSKVFVTGQSRDDTTMQDQATVGYDAATGERLWVARQDHAAAFDTGSAIAASDETVVVTGRSIGQGFDWLTTAYDAVTGELQWSHRFVGPKKVDDTSWSVVASPDGEVFFVTGGIDDGATVAGDALTIAYDGENGDVLWDTRYDGGLYDAGYRLALAPDGETLFLLGTTRRPSLSNDLLVAALAPRTGYLRWSVAIDGARSVDNPEGIAVAPDGSRVVVTGTSDGVGTGTDVLTVALDAASGETAWTARYNGARNGNDSAAGVAIAGGRAVVAAAGTEGVAGLDAVVRGYDLATGDVAWTRIDNTLAYFADTPLALTAWGSSVYLSGYFNVPRGEILPLFKIEPATMMTAAYDAASGTRRWVANHNETGVGADVGVAITAGTGGVYSAGTFVFSGVYLYPLVPAKPYAYDIGVVAYDH